MKDVLKRLVLITPQPQTDIRQIKKKKRRFWQVLTKQQQKKVYFCSADNPRGHLIYLSTVGHLCSHEKCESFRQVNEEPVLLNSVLLPGSSCGCKKKQHKSASDFIMFLSPLWVHEKLHRSISHFGRCILFTHVIVGVKTNKQTNNDNNKSLSGPV